MTQEMPKLEPPKPLDPAVLRRTLITGGVLAFGGVVLFVVLWVGLGSANVEAFPRLILSLCIPPAVITLILGAFILFVRRPPSHP